MLVALDDAKTLGVVQRLELRDGEVPPHAWEGPSRSAPAAVPATPSGRARHPPPQGRNEGGEAMGAVIACAVTAVLSSTVTLVAYACCAAAGNADRIEEGNE